jgi:hypothetical protein
MVENEVDKCENETVKYDVYKQDLAIDIQHRNGHTYKDLAQEYDCSTAKIASVCKKVARHRARAARKKRIYKIAKSKAFSKAQMAKDYFIDEKLLVEIIQEQDVVAKYLDHVPVNVILHHYHLSLDDFERILYLNVVTSYFISGS